MRSVEKRSWEFDFAANSHAYTGYTAIINSIVVLRYWGISGKKMENKQGETRRIESPMCHSYVSLPRVSLMSLSPVSLFSMSLAYPTPLTRPWLSSLYLSSKRDRGERRGNETLERGGGGGDGVRQGRERQGREMMERDRGGRRRRET